MMHSRNVLVDLPKDRRPEVYRFRPPRGDAKGCRGAFHLLGKSKLCSRKNAHRRCGILRRSKPSSTSVEVDCPKLVTDLGRPRFDVVETVVTHGRGTPLTSRSPQPFLLPEPAQNSNRARRCEPLRGQALMNEGHCRAKDNRCLDTGDPRSVRKLVEGEVLQIDFSGPCIIGYGSSPS